LVDVEKFPFQMMHQPITDCVTTLHGQHNSLLNVLLATRPQVNHTVAVNSLLPNRAVNRAFLQPTLRVTHSGSLSR